MGTMMKPSFTLTYKNPIFLAVVLLAASTSGFATQSQLRLPTSPAIAAVATNYYNPKLSSNFKSTTSALLSSSPEGNSNKDAVLSSETASPYKLIDYNWKDQWYALTFASYVPNPSKSAEVTPAAVFGHPLVLWKSKDNGPIHCADDVCPHRAAALSEGRIRDGKLECYYHGWQFEGGNTKTNTDDPNKAADAGACTFIPQLEPGATIPKAACLRLRVCRVVEGIVWVWMGDTDEPTKDPPTQKDGLDPITGERDGFLLNDFQIDLPYDHSYLVENLIDPAHIPISHDRTPGGGRRENAEAYEMIVDPDSISADGFTGRYRTKSQQRKDGPFIQLQYEAPGIIRQQGFPRGENSTLQFGAALHCMPLTLGRSRLLFRSYFGGLPRKLQFLLAAKPTFLTHLNSCKILEQDVGLITTQEDHFKRNPDRKLKDDFLMLQSADVFVKAYRQWLDRVGSGMPWFQGLATRSSNVDDHLTDFATPPALDPVGHRASNFLETRYHRHVIHCPETRNALKTVRMLKKAAFAISIVAITTACGLAGATTSTTTSGALVVSNARNLSKAFFRVLVPIIPVSCAAAAALHRLEQAFYVSFKRKDQMRGEKGI